jgi:formamidopyrimidine-DNA glycosylase
MPELPEVEILVRHLAPLLKNRTIRRVTVCRAKTVAPSTVAEFTATLPGKVFGELTRRGKYLVFSLKPARGKAHLTLLGHLGMTGRLYLQPASQPPPKHASVLFHLGRLILVFEDPRYFGRMTLDSAPLSHLGPEPLENAFTVEYLGRAMRRSAQATKVKLLDQSLVAGLGNIYASEALFRAEISPRQRANRLAKAQIERLWQAIREVLTDAIAGGSTVPLDWAGTHGRDRLFYYGRAAGASEHYQERLLVYDRQDQPCVRCVQPIRRLQQAGRSTYYCSHCQRGR